MRWVLQMQRIIALSFQMVNFSKWDRFDVDAAEAEVERKVRLYFDGVYDDDAVLLKNCFGVFLVGPFFVF